MMTEDDRRNWELAKTTIDSMQEPKDTRNISTDEYFNKPLYLQNICGFECSAHFYKMRNGKNERYSQVIIWNNKYCTSYAKYFGGNKTDDSRNVFVN